MQFNKTVSNPMLMGTAELVRAEDTPEHRNRFIAEMMKATFLAPAMVTPPPVMDEDGELRLVEDCEIQFPMLVTNEGKHYFMAYTNQRELDKWKSKEQHYNFCLNFNDYVGLLFGKNKLGLMTSALGFVINPYGDDIIISKEMVAGLVAARKQKESNPEI